MNRCTKLNLGCGKDIREGFINIDRIAWPGVDLVLDLSCNKLPFDDGTVNEIRAYDILEHLWDWENLMHECIRVLKVWGVIEIHVPYGVDLNTYHKRFFNETTFDGFLEESVNFTGPNATTLEGRPVFKRIRREFQRKAFYPFAWHLQKYLRLPYIGKKIGMTEIFALTVKR